MDALLGCKSLPPGFRFHPTDQELFMFYLKRKMLGKSLDPQMMSEVDVFQFAPWELPEKACLTTKDLIWYFICPRSKKYPNAGRVNRATVHGYWKSTGIDRTVDFKNRPVGKIKTLIFYRGKAPKGERTDWVMHEYKLDDRRLLEKGFTLDSYVICKLYEKSGLGPKNGENYGAPFVEEEWDFDIDNNFELERGLVLQPMERDIAGENATQIQLPVTVDVAHSQDGSDITDTMADYNPVGPSTPTTVQQLPLPGLPPIETEEDELDRLLAVFTEGNGNSIRESNVSNGLRDFGGGSLDSEIEFDWCQLLSENYYLELKDLQD